FPARPAVKTDLPDGLLSALCSDITPKGIYKSRDYMLVYEKEVDVKQISPDFMALDKIADVFGVIVTAPGDEVDFVSRYFSPGASIPEDPVTGSTHCTLIPYWAEQLGKNELQADQISTRKGKLWCFNKDDRVLISGVHALSNDTNIPCVIQTAGVKLDQFNINLPDRNSFLSSKQISQLKYRIYNVAYHLRLIVSIGIKLLPLVSTIFRSPPKIPGPFYNTLTLKKNFFTTTECLHLHSIPPTLFPLSGSSPYSIYLGPFIDESSVHHATNDLVEWVQSKPKHSIIYVAFGSSAQIRSNKMKSLIDGVMEFLLHTPTASVLFAFRKDNYNNYQKIRGEMKNDEYQRILSDEQRCRVESSFVPQKWILQQNSVSLFISHCGMGSVGEGLYFQKPILCLPICTDQFLNAMAIDHTGVGASLFIPPTLWQSLLRPDGFHHYTFLASEVTSKLFTMWENTTYVKEVQMMSLKMKHAGGVKRGVEEIEFFVNVHGDLHRYMPFSNTLAFYQRYMLDLILVCIVLPIVIIFYLAQKFCRSNMKNKID
ncbi:unnamed protein product, partial [Rotaria magnacalcarata]